jgi:hypothetical protein
MQLDQSFNVSAYIDDGRLDHAFMGAILDTLKVSQHLYKREDLAKLYHFIGDLFESGKFSWGGDVSFAPDDKKALTKNQKNGKVSKE